MKARIENQIWDTIRNCGAKISHLDNPSRAKSLSSADGTSRAWSAIGRVLVTLPLAIGFQTDQLINDALEVVLQEDEIVGESGSNPLAPLQSKIINLGQQLYKALFQGSLKQSWIKAQEIAQTEQEVQLLGTE